MKPWYLLLLTLSTLPAVAAELSIKPGLWESTTTRTSSMGGGAVTETHSECVEEKTFDPQQIMKDMQDCELLENTLQNANTLVFSMACSMEGAKASLKGKYYTKGDVGKGDMKVQVNMGGMSMNMDLNWDAKRLGDC